jgi:hypothetical protein
MIKHFKQSIFFACVLLAHPSLYSATNYWNWYKNKPDQKTFEDAEKAAKDKFEESLKPHNQTPEIKNLILNRKSAQAQRIKQTLALLYLSKTQTRDIAKNMAEEAAYDLALELMLNDVATKLGTAITAFGKQATEKDIEKILSIINKEFIGKLQKSYTPGYVLEEFTKPDYTKSSKIERMINQEVAKLPDNFQEVYVSENDIKEICANNDSALISVAKENGTLQRTSNCTGCGNSFNHVANRVNLRCGHGTMCPACFIKRFYIDGNHYCNAVVKEYDKYGNEIRKICNKKTEAADFPVSNLKKYIDMEKLKKRSLAIYQAIQAIVKRN